MSVAGIIEAMRAKGWPTGQRQVWQCLENHANGARCWRMTFQAIADELHIGLNTVRRAVARMEAEGIVRVERHERRPSVFHMQRNYAKSNGHTPNSHGNLSAQKERSTTQPHTELSAQNGHQKHELTLQNGRSTTELSAQNGRPLESTSKNPPKGSPPGVARSRAAPRKALPETWQPNEGSMALGATLSLSHHDILAEAEKMHDWARHRGEIGANWDARFNNWLRKEASDRLHRRRNTDKRTVQDLQKEWNLPSFLTPNFDDDEPPMRAPMPLVLQS